MRRLIKILASLSFMMGLLIVSSQNLLAQETKAPHIHDKADAHGGIVVMTKQHHFEVVFKPDGIRVYLYDYDQKPLADKDVIGNVTLKFKNSDKRTLDFRPVTAYEMAGKQKQQHHHQSMGMDYLQATVDLSKVEPGSLTAEFSFKKLAHNKESEVTFTRTFDGYAKEMMADKQYEHR